MRRAGQRGQATVELALGGTLVVTIILLGLWLSEVSFLSLKVQEASAAAVWDSTGRPTFDYEHWNSPTEIRQGFVELHPAVSTALTNRYKDFDARGGGDGTARLFARGQQLQVRCEPLARGSRVIAFNMPAATPYHDGTGTVPSGVNSLLRRWYQPLGGSSCVAEATAVPFELPETYLARDDKGFFSTPLARRLPIRLCGAGRAVSGSCEASYGVLLGDWGMDGDNTSRARRQLTRDVVLPAEGEDEPARGTNRVYWQMVRSLFRRSGERYDADGPPGAASRFAAKVAAQRTPHNEHNYYMSFAGVEHNYVDMLEPATLIPFQCRNCHFNTAGTQTVNGNPTPDPDADWNNRRKPCFLGLGGCRVPR